MKQNNTRAFTLIELLVVISIIALLVGILLPALSAARGSAQRVACLSNVRQIGIAIFSYSTDNNDFFPHYKMAWISQPSVNARNNARPPSGSTEEAYWWTATLVADDYLPGPVAFDCPTFEVIPESGRLDLSAMTAGETPGDKAVAGWNNSEYGYNCYFLGGGWGLNWKDVPARRGSIGFSPLLTKKTPRVDEVTKAAETIVLADSRNYATELALAARGFNYTFGVGYLYPSYDPPLRQYGYADPRHKSSLNVFWADGHGENVQVQNEDNPYQLDELTDAVRHPLDNKWDLH